MIKSPERSPVLLFRVPVYPIRVLNVYSGPRSSSAAEDVTTFRTDAGMILSSELYSQTVVPSFRSTMQPENEAPDIKGLDKRDFDAFSCPEAAAESSRTVSVTLQAGLFGGVLS